MCQEKLIDCKILEESEKNLEETSLRQFVLVKLQAYIGQTAASVTIDRSWPEMLLYSCRFIKN